MEFHAWKHWPPRINRYGQWRNLWWEYLLHHPPGHCWGTSLSHSTKKLMLMLTVWRLNSSRCLSFGLDYYWDGWRGPESLLIRFYQRAEGNQPWLGSRSHQVPESWQSTRSWWYTEKGPETSFITGDLAPRHSLQCYPHNSVFPIRMEARASSLHPEAWEGPSSAIVLSTCLDKIAKLFENILNSREFRSSDCNTLGSNPENLPIKICPPIYLRLIKWNPLYSRLWS